MRLYAAASRGDERWPFRRVETGGLAAGLLFALHPVQTEAVTYVSGRSSSLMTSFTLLALLLYVEGARSDRAWLWCGLAPLAFVCALLAKEPAAMLPAGLLLWEICFERPRASRLLLRQAVWWSLLLALLAAAIMQRRYFALLYDLAGARPLIDSLAYQIDGAAYLLSRLVLIHRLSIDPGLGLRPPTGVELSTAALLVAALALFATANWRKRPAAAFGVSWFLLYTFFPYVLLPRVDVVNERHMYLANVGLFVAVGALWAELAERPGVLPGARRFAIVVTGLLVIGTALRNFDYRSETALWESTVRVTPSNPRAYNNLGIAYESSGRTGDARSAYGRAVALEPRYLTARRNLERVENRSP
jgi:tetratricopeptide (TPR) repeat protein